eukprot:contig_21206_g5206
MPVRKDDVPAGTDEAGVGKITVTAGMIWDDPVETEKEVLSPARSRLYFGGKPGGGGGGSSRRRRRRRRRPAPKAVDGGTLRLEEKAAVKDKSLFATHGTVLDAAGRP